ncbi:MAG: hypothetical protein ACYDHX_04065 [Methanothrix sp.]
MHAGPELQVLRGCGLGGGRWLAGIRSSWIIEAGRVMVYFSFL